jgi:hypothetical protein
MSTDPRRRPLNTYFLFCKSLFFKCKAKHRQVMETSFKALPNISLSMDSKIVLWKSDSSFLDRVLLCMNALFEYRLAFDGLFPLTLFSS